VTLPVAGFILTIAASALVWWLWGRNLRTASLLVVLVSAVIVVAVPFTVSNGAYVWLLGAIAGSAIANAIFWRARHVIDRPHR
jgi:hypothetical protein